LRFLPGCHSLSGTGKGAFTVGDGFAEGKRTQKELAHKFLFVLYVKKNIFVPTF
jgi:hypothetical protein